MRDNLVHTVLPMNLVFFEFYVVTKSEFRNSEATCNSKTFDFTYWGTFSAQNSEVFVQTNFFSVFKNGFALSKIYLVKILEIVKSLKIYLRIHKILHLMAERIF